MRINKPRTTLFVIFLSLLFSACSDDNEQSYPDVDGLAPTIVLSNDLIQSEKDKTVQIKARIEDQDGIKSIRLKNEGLQLDKIIDIVGIYNERVTEYDLDYAFKLEAKLSEADFPVVITATDLGGRTTEVTQRLTTDVDFTAPKFTYAPAANITAIDKGARTNIQLRFRVEDNRTLTSVEISIPEKSFYQKEVIDNKAEFEYSERIDLDPSITPYNITIKATDGVGNMTETKTVVTVSPMPDFVKMYLVDVENAKDLTSDMFGVPMLIERTAAYQYRARYYSSKENSKIRFIPQKTDFYPICFGKDPSSNTLIDEPDMSEAIVLPQIGYYEITFNVQTGIYSVARYTPTDTPIEIGKIINKNDGDLAAGTMPFEMGLIGYGIPLPSAGDTWTPKNMIKLTQNPDNKFELWAEMDLVAGNKVKLGIIPYHPWGWWLYPAWRFETVKNNSGENEYNTLMTPSVNGDLVSDMTETKVKTSGKYRFVLDTHLLRSKLYPVE